MRSSLAPAPSAGGGSTLASAPREVTLPAPRAPASRRRSNLALAAGTVLFSLLLAEAAIRTSGIAGAGRGSPWFAGGNHPRFLFQADPRSGYRLRANFRGRQIAPGRDFDVPVVTDAAGMRDHRHAAAAEPAVLALGDSMTFGEGVDVERTWTAVLERRLGRRVYAAGVPGYASPQMLGELVRLTPLLSPELVLVALFPRLDRQRCRTPFRYLGGYIVGSGYVDKLHLIDGNLYLADVAWPVAGPATAHAKRWSHLARLALPAVRRGAGWLAGRRDAAGADPSTGQVEPTADALDRLRRRAAAGGAPLLVILLDSPDRDFELDRDALAAALRARGIPYLALDELLAGRDWAPLHFARDGHWNAAGHGAVGAALVPAVRAALGARAAAQ